MTTTVTPEIQIEPAKQLKDGVVAMGNTILGSLRILRDHWPQLIGLFLLGWTGRMGFLWLATEVSKFSPTLAVFILPLAPLSSIIAMVLMLRIVATTLPSFQHVFDGLPAAERWRDHLTVIGQTLLPFLAVYASQGLLKQDALVFLEDTTMDDLMNSMIPKFDRALYAPGAWIFVMIIGVLILRKIIALTGVGSKSLAAAGFAAYLEALWLVTLAQAIVGKTDVLITWLKERAVIDGLLRSADSVITWLGAIGQAIMTAIGWLGGMLSSGLSVIIIPISALAVGAAVYGRELKEGPPIPTHEGMTRRLKQVPNPMKRVVGQVFEPVTTPVLSAWNSLGKIIVAGFIPTILFCIVFVLLNQLDNVVAYVLRAVAPPRSRDLAFAIEPYLNMVSQLVFTVAAVALLAAAVNVIVAAQPAKAEQD